MVALGTLNKGSVGIICHERETRCLEESPHDCDGRGSYKRQRTLLVNFTSARGPFPLARSWWSLYRSLEKGTAAVICYVKWELFVERSSRQDLWSILQASAYFLNLRGHDNLSLRLVITVGIKECGARHPCLCSARRDRSSQWYEATATAVVLRSWKHQRSPQIYLGVWIVSVGLILCLSSRGSGTGAVLVMIEMEL